MYPAELKYTKDHEWIRKDGDEYIVGITAFAAEQLGDVTYVELPSVGKAVKSGGETASVESVKAASDVYAPVAGTVSAVNDALDATPELVNESPYEQGWFFKLKDVDAAAVDALMNAAQYETLTKEQDH
jgi:glycine cleavage system H protein